MTARAVGAVQDANGITARSAAKPRNGAKQCLADEKNRPTAKLAWTGGCPMERRMQYLPLVPRCRLMKSSAALSRVATHDQLAGTGANQPAVLISAANVAAVCPATGI
jgi:hypothetical protein